MAWAPRSRRRPSRSCGSAAARTGGPGSGILDDAAAARIDADADKAVAAAVDFVDASPAPDLATLFDHVYATPAASVYHGATAAGFLTHLKELLEQPLDIVL